jgi:hypothetical protein
LTGDDRGIGNGEWGMGQDKNSNYDLVNYNNNNNKGATEGDHPGRLRNRAKSSETTKVQQRFNKTATKRKK